MTALALVGDWNATPADRGRWSPSWLATGAGLRIVSAGPGRHGDIDYAMTDAKVIPPGVGRQATRRPPPGAAHGASDHDVYSVLLQDARESHATVLLASWNMRYGRTARRAEADLRMLLHRQDIDVLALQEAADYHTQIRDVARLCDYVVLASGRPGQWHNVLLVRAQLGVSAGRFIRLSPHGWRLVSGGSHAELWATSWCVAGWLRVVDLHLPPSVNWVQGRIRGPVMRVAAYVAATGKLRRWARRWRRRNT